MRACFRSSCRSLRVAALLAVGAATMLLAAPALAQTSVVSKRFAFEDRNGLLTVSGGFRELFDNALRKRLRSGFATTVVMRVYLYAQGGGKPITVRVRTLRAVYDLWEQRFMVRFEDRRGRRYRKFLGDGAVIDRLTSLWRFPMVRMSTIARGHNYFIALIVEVNPMSREVLAEVRHWLRRPSGGHSIGTESFFGSFVSIFVNNKVRRSERTWKVRSQLFYKP